MHRYITIPEGFLTIEVIPGGYITGMSASPFFPRLKVLGTVKAGQTYQVEMRRELRRLADDESAADAIRYSTNIQADDSGLYHWRPATATGLSDKAQTAAGQCAVKTWLKLEAIADRECHAFHTAHPGWEQYSLRLHHIRSHQRACDEALRAERQLEQLASTARRLRDEHQLTDAEAVLEVPR